MLALAVLLVRVRIDASTAEPEVEPEARVNPEPATPSLRALDGARRAVLRGGVGSARLPIQSRDAATLRERQDLASFLGLFYVVTGLAALLVQASATRWMIQKLGASWGAALLPPGSA